LARAVSARHIFYADHGHPVPEIIHDYWKASAPGLMQDSESRRVFLPGDTVPETDQIFRNLHVAQVADPRRICYHALREAMDHYEKAMNFARPGNDDAILRWNTCMRVIMQNPAIRPAPENEAAQAWERDEAGSRIADA
jgi:hypothetical protein